MDTLYETRYSYNFFYRHHNYIGGSIDKYHMHDDYEIYISCTDSGYFVVNGQKSPLSYGDIFFFSNTDIHKVYIEKNTPYERHIIMFDSSYLKDLKTPKTDLLCIFQQEKTVKKLSRKDYDFLHVFPKLTSQLNEIEFYYQKLNHYGNDISLKLSFAMFLLDLNRLYMKAYPNEIKEPSPDLEASDPHNQIQEILRYIHASYQEKISLDTLADTFYMSKTHLNNLFRQNLGKSAKKYIISVRLTHAKHLLKDGVSVQDTCMLCGFNNISHFIRTFSKHIGMSPKQYALYATEDYGHLIH